MTNNIRFDIQPFSERGWLARLSGFTNDVECGLFANAVADTIRVQNGMSDVIAGIDSLTLRFDPAILNEQSARHALTTALQQTNNTAIIPSPEDAIKIPVLYGAAAGPDLEDLCARNELTKAQAIELHASKTYRVITLGFAPGFAYLGPLDKPLHTARLATPRPRLAAGSVGVAGGFTGVYSLPSPGGWNIIGRTPLRLFDGQSAAPFLFKAGGSIRFHPISVAEFDSLHKQIK